MEGRHSRIHGILKRAPRASLAYINLELRFSNLQQLAATRPSIINGIIKQITGIETGKGLQHAVM